MRWEKLVVALLFAVAVVVPSVAGEAAAPKKEEAKPTKWAPAVEPKPLSENVKRGLAFLVATQNDDGGFGQGEESKQMGTSLARLKDKSNVADTCMATLALIRAGSTPSKGPHAKQINKALAFICAEVEKSDEKSLFITAIRGTRVQTKLGAYIDTFLAAMVLAEAKDQMPDAKGKKLILAALDKTMDKIEKNQRKDGTWDNRGWAPALQQAMASKAINRFAQVNGDSSVVSENVRAKAEGYARSGFDVTNGTFRTGGSAGVKLYAGAANLGAMQDSDNTNETKVATLREIAKNGKTKEEREGAQKTLVRYEQTKRDLASAKTAIVKKLEDKRFIAGFGSNGGEEFLSYMNIGETLVVTGGDKWEKWDKSITENLNRIQNKDGSWSGHHCITGRNFCTAAALLVLTTDRAPVPVAAKVKKR